MINKMDASNNSQNYFKEFLVGLLSLIDDANLSSYNSEATKKLEEAYKLYLDEYSKYFVD